MNERMTDS